MIPKPIEFFENAAKSYTRIFRSKSICDCDDCIAYLEIGLIVYPQDVERLFNEQKKGVEFSKTKFKNLPTINHVISPKEREVIKTKDIESIFDKVK